MKTPGKDTQTQTSSEEPSSNSEIWLQSNFNLNSSKPQLTTISSVST